MLFRYTIIKLFRYSFKKKNLKKIATAFINLNYIIISLNNFFLV